MKDIWPSRKEIEEYSMNLIKPELIKESYRNISTAKLFGNP